MKKNLTNYESYWSIPQEQPVVCGLIQPQVVISEYAHKKIKYLMNKFPTTEWAVELLGTIEDNLIYISDIYVFEQEVTVASVERVGQPHPQAIGVLHSHHRMGSFFSSCDRDFANSNWDIGGVVDNKFNYKFSVRRRTPCGRIARVEVEGIVDDEVIEVDTSNIREKRYIYYYNNKFLDYDKEEI